MAEPTKDDVDALVGPATPHFAYQLRARVRQLIADLAEDHPVRRYGEEQGFRKLTEAEWAPEGDDGHDVMLVSACIIGAPAFFHDHYQNLAMFFVLDGLERIPGGRG